MDERVEYAESNVKGTEGTRRVCGATRVALVALCASMILLQLVALWSDSYAYNEHGRLASGLVKLARGDFSIFRVNPPLPDMIGALPARALGAAAPDRASLNLAPFARTEYGAGSWFIEHNENHFLCLRLGRVCELIFSLVGALACFYYGRWLFGDVAGLFACGLWVFSPYVLGFGRLVCPDVPSAALGIATVGVFHYWLASRNRTALLASGILLGLAELCKYTLLVLYPIFFLLWLIYRGRDLCRAGLRAWFKEFCALMIYVFVMSVVVINIGYLFERSFVPLGEYRFETALFSGADSYDKVQGRGGNRFKDTPLAKLPVPLPYNYVLGIDTQRLDFESGMKSYWRGDWSERGWLLFYADALLLKTPLGALILFLLALVLATSSGAYRRGWRDELVLWTPGVVIFLFVSSQTGFSIHSRYMIPALPTFFVATCRVGRLFSSVISNNLSGKKLRALQTLVVLAASWNVVGILATYPHEISYFNELTPLLNPSKDHARIPELPSNANAITRIKRALTCGCYAAPRHFIDSNVDWGVEEYRLDQWLRNRSDIDRLVLVLWSEWRNEIKKEFEGQISGPSESKPYWFAISVNELYTKERHYRYLWEISPKTIIGYSIYVYRVDPKVDLPPREKREDGANDESADESQQGNQTDE
ncbi:MAG: glycosyltransferase family 39 protein [Thermoguttaceae bacterium]|nr:glycosyltransferase family 39 protein [Thermoguttaceae bacterium]